MSSDRAGYPQSVSFLLQQNFISNEPYPPLKRDVSQGLSDALSHPPGAQLKLMQKLTFLMQEPHSMWHARADASAQVFFHYGHPPYVPVIGNPLQKAVIKVQVLRLHCSLIGQ
jgi:hypothetical protein